MKYKNGRVFKAQVTRMPFSAALVERRVKQSADIEKSIANNPFSSDFEG